MGEPHVGYAMATALLIVVLLFAAIFGSGSTFGQRCERAFPTDPARQELCIYNLSKGNTP